VYGVVVPLALVCGLALSARPAVAEPYLAVRTGLRCAQCHVNRTGGGGRNAFGSAWAQTQLPITSAGVRSRNLNDWVALGLDVRAAFTASLTDDSPRTTLDVPEAQVQMEARLIANRLAVYVDETVGPDRATAREAFGLVERLPLNGYAKAGKFLLPYGWRLWDDEAFIRRETGFTYLTPDLGLEVGIEPGPLSWVLAVTNGSVGAAEGNDAKMVTSSAVFTHRRFRIGASASRNAGPGTHREVVGGYGGLSLGPVALLGEADWILQSFDGQADRDQFVAYLEGNWLARRGVNVKLTYGFHDPDVDLPEDERVRWRAGVELFPISFVQLAGFFVRSDNAGVGDDRSRVDLEAHVHF
jgi:hypothetical protein